MIFIIAALFALDDVMARLLQFAGIRHLLLLANEYASLVGRVPSTKLVHFQLLELVALFSIGIWGVRVLAGIICLKQYDRFFLAVSKTDYWRLYAALLFGAVCLYTAFDLTSHPAPALFALAMRDAPRFYFGFISLMSFWSFAWIASSVLFIFWKLFRQHRPGAVLWRDPSQAQRDP